MFEILMSLPLFHGVSLEKISCIVENTKFHFLKYDKGQTIIHSGDACTHIKFIISGSVKSTINNVDNDFSVSQTLDAPDVITPDFLFGRTTTYPCSVTALENTGILQISKADYITLLSTDKIFMFNFLNMLSSNSQKAFDGAAATNSNNIKHHIAFRIIALTQSRGRNISLSCKNMPKLFGCTQNQLNTTLESLKQQRIIDFTPTEISILSRADLVNILSGK